MQQHAPNVKRRQWRWWSISAVSMIFRPHDFAQWFMIRYVTDGQIFMCVCGVESNEPRRQMCLRLLMCLLNLKCKGRFQANCIRENRGWQRLSLLGFKELASPLGTKHVTAPSNLSLDTKQAAHCGWRNATAIVTLCLGLVNHDRFVAPWMKHAWFGVPCTTPVGRPPYSLSKIVWFVRLFWFRAFGVHKSVPARTIHHFREVASLTWSFLCLFSPSLNNQVWTL